jgi:hypothetical protein
MDKNRIKRPELAGELAKSSEAHIHQGELKVNPAAVRRRRSNLPREICSTSWIHDWGGSDLSRSWGRSQQRAK